MYSFSDRNLLSSTDHKKYFNMKIIICEGKKQINKQTQSNQHITHTRQDKWTVFVSNLFCLGSHKSPTKSFQSADIKCFTVISSFSLRYYLCLCFFLFLLSRWHLTIYFLNHLKLERNKKQIWNMLLNFDGKCFITKKMYNLVGFALNNFSDVILCVIFSVSQLYESIWNNGCRILKQ